MAVCAVSSEFLSLVTEPYHLIQHVPQTDRLAGSHDPPNFHSVFNRENTGNLLSLKERICGQNCIIINEDKVFREFHFSVANQEQGINRELRTLERTLG